MEVKRSYLRVAPQAVRVVCFPRVPCFLLLIVCGCGLKVNGGGGAGGRVPLRRRVACWHRAAQHAVEEAAVNTITSANTPRQADIPARRRLRQLLHHHPRRCSRNGPAYPPRPSKVTHPSSLPPLPHSFPASGRDHRRTDAHPRQP